MKIEKIKVSFKSGAVSYLYEDEGFYDRIEQNFMHGDFGSMLSFMVRNKKTKISFHPSSVESFELV